MIRHSGQISKENILAGNYASQTSASESSGSNSDSGSASNSGQINRSETTTKNVTGKDSKLSYQELIKQFRENIIDIDSQIIDDLNGLFMGLY